ncbi:MAG TPA: 16S rRNA (guanine(527)-N(7))-methyltransferase RsmG [Bacteroidales bacterium]|nr:16S rRNA (guanine(527)-N(7))-methyltransferase RsmG [Bacteroidales bacterium]
MDLLLKYFPDLSGEQQEKFRQLGELFLDWNSKINLVSRKDMPHLYERHILHSLVIAKVLPFKPQSRILDVGTGGGFPGIPLAVLFPEASFTLVDSINKKIMVVNNLIAALELRNAEAVCTRAEKLDGKWHFVTSRAVTSFPKFYTWVENKISADHFNDRPNGILYLKGGDFREEIQPFHPRIEVFNISDFFTEPFFETKKIVYLPLTGKA